MKNVFLLFFLFLLVSCKDEPETGLTIILNSEIDFKVNLVRSPNGSAPLDTVFTFANDLDEFEESYNLEGGSDSYPTSIHRTFLSSDTIILVYQDTLPVIHINRQWLEHFPNPDSTNLYLDDARNIYNSDNFEKSRKGESQYEGIYRITQEDIDYSIEVNK
jgi:hypothetical protein